MRLKKYEVPASKLRWVCDPGLFKFECTKDLVSLREFIGQERATRALEFGLNMMSAGYNIYVGGLTGTGKTSMEIQSIGGVNHKIEGFFRVCQAKGLSGDQKVLIPYQNLRNLMLREEVVSAVRNGKFCIYAAKTIDEGIEILTGVPAGERQEDGTYPQGTINFLVDKQLREMADRLKGFYAEEKWEGR